jgi:hypothetical protein
MDREHFLPIDLGNIQEKAIKIQHLLSIINNPDRSENMKKVSLKSIESITDTMVRDIDHYFETKTFNGRIALGLEE